MPKTICDIFCHWNCSNACAGFGLMNFSHAFYIITPITQPYQLMIYINTVIFEINVLKQRCTRGYKRYKETSGLIEWKECQIFHSIFT